ncbi:di-trans,poly-cis-decaprenylcistransferase [SAR202 cluster bacterium AC-409-J13_OGT_754m]|nr:di-trans,poly-cis-decaprenylcistransferase [SAR202 cluster bacterium AC-409-J13_OGT_754m]
MDNLNVPLHVAVIMDGNGRWASNQGLPRLDGHRAGVKRIRLVLEKLASFGIKYVTIFAFSTENWSRPQTEVSGLMGMLREVIDLESQSLHKLGARIIHLGRRDRLDPDLLNAINKAQELTKHNNYITLCVAFDYGGKDEIVEAIKRIIIDGITPSEINETLFANYLYTKGIPDPDLIIRTGGEQRMSNFLLWQSAYSEFYSTNTFWPDLGPLDIEKAIAAYRNRGRRFGKVVP